MALPVLSTNSIFESRSVYKAVATEGSIERSQKAERLAKELVQKVDSMNCSEMNSNRILQLLSQTGQTMASGAYTPSI